MSRKTLILYSLAFLLTLTGCSTTGTMYHVSEMYDRDTEITSFEMVFYREHEMVNYQTWQTAIDTLEIMKLTGGGKEDAYLLSVVYEGGSSWKYYDDFTIEVDGSTYEFLDNDPMRKNIYGGKVMEIATVWLSDECVDALRTCRTLTIKASTLVANIPPEGISEIQDFIEYGAGEPDAE